jgi:SAM-dependent methyltransferase
VLPFESHNVELRDGTQTLPGQPLIRDTQLFKASLRAMRELVPSDPDTPTTVIDLGCREGGFALEFAKEGFQVLGLEVRQSNVDRCRIVAESWNLPNLRFVCDDARNVLDHGTFDVTFCSGLLYHLDRPVDFVNRLGKLTERLLVLNTHYSESRPTPAFELSELSMSEGVLGRWYRDLQPGTTHDQMEANRGASWGNTDSFWVEKLHLMRTMRDAGFDFVLEQFDFLDDIVRDCDNWITQQTRSQFLGLKRPAAP